MEGTVVAGLATSMSAGATSDLATASMSSSAATRSLAAPTPRVRSHYPAGGLPRHRLHHRPGRGLDIRSSLSRRLRYYHRFRRDASDNCKRGLMHGRRHDAGRLDRWCLLDTGSGGEATGDPSDRSVAVGIPLVGAADGATMPGACNDVAATRSYRRRGRALSLQGTRGIDHGGRKRL